MVFFTCPLRKQWAVSHLQNILTNTSGDYRINRIGTYQLHNMIKEIAPLYVLHDMTLE